MKILFISNIGLPPNFPNVDYMNDMVFHGLRSLFGADVVDHCKHPSAYKGITAEERKTMYGRGFTIAGNLDDIEVDRTDIEAKIRKKYFDLIVYGQCTRSLDHITLVQNCYPKDKIVFVDGEDDQRVRDISALGHYFKRELTQERQHVHPITFCIPEEKLIKELPFKTQDHSIIIPGQPYNFDTEDEYYEEYQQSRFAVTCKKAGWDCLRHYEIMMNRCIPFFRGLEELPQHTMVHFPRALLYDANRMVNYKDIPDGMYEDYENRLFEHTKKHLTTKAMAQYILETI